MQVILLERIEKLGQMGDVVTVRPGYARNFLLPQKKARRATKENLAVFEEQRTQLEAENIKHRDEAEKVGSKLDGIAVTLIRQAGESGQLYGSVNTRNIADSVTEAGFTVSREQIVLNKVIKSLGLHEVKIRLHPEVTVAVTANVARSAAEAETQARTGHLVSPEEQRAAEDAAAAEQTTALAEVEAAEEAEAEAAALSGDGESDAPAESKKDGEA